MLVYLFCGILFILWVIMLVVFLWRTKGGAVFKAIEGLEEKIAAAAKAEEVRVRNELTAEYAKVKAEIIEGFQADIKKFEERAVAQGVVLDDAFIAKLNAIKTDLVTEQNALAAPNQAQAPAAPASIA